MSLRLTNSCYVCVTQSYETVMENASDETTAFNLVVAYHALGDKEKMKKAFLKQLQMQTPEEVEAEEEATGDMEALHDG